MCLTDNGISACHCRPGFTRNKLRDVCRKIVSVLLSLRVDRIHERKVVWLNELSNRNSDIYQQLAYEAGRAVSRIFQFLKMSQPTIANFSRIFFYLDRSKLALARALRS